MEKLLNGTPFEFGLNVASIETFHGYVETTIDALLIFECTRSNILRRVKTRLSDGQRKEIRSGSIFVYDENESGIKRWTDGRLWSPSRTLGNFLVYRELEKKYMKPKGSQASQSPESEFSMIPGAAMKTKRSKNVSLILPPDEQGSDLLSSTPTFMFLNGSDGIDPWNVAEQEGKQVSLGSKGAYVFKKNGLIKKTISVMQNSIQQHLVCYFSKQEVQMGKVMAVRKHAHMKDIIISPIFIMEQNFRKPVTETSLQIMEKSSSEENQLGESNGQQCGCHYGTRHDCDLGGEMQELKGSAESVTQVLNGLRTSEDGNLEQGLWSQFMMAGAQPHDRSSHLQPLLHDATAPPNAVSTDSSPQSLLRDRWSFFDGFGSMSLLSPSMKEGGSKINASMFCGASDKRTFANESLQNPSFFTLKEEDLPQEVDFLFHNPHEFLFPNPHDFLVHTPHGSAQSSTLSASHSGIDSASHSDVASASSPLQTQDANHKRPRNMPGIEISDFLASVHASMNLLSADFMAAKVPLTRFPDDYLDRRGNGAAGDPLFPALAMAEWMHPGDFAAVDACDALAGFSQVNSGFSYANDGISYVNGAFSYVNDAFSSLDFAAENAFGHANPPNARLSTAASAESDASWLSTVFADDSLSASSFAEAAFSDFSFGGPSLSCDQEPSRKRFKSLDFGQNKGFAESPSLIIGASANSYSDASCGNVYSDLSANVYSNSPANVYSDSPANPGQTSKEQDSLLQMLLESYSAMQNILGN